MAHFFTLTPGTDNFTGLAGDDNEFQFTPSTLQSTDTITGGATASFLDILVATAGGAIASSQFSGVTLVEQMNLSSGGNNVTLSNSLVAGSSVGYFAVVDGGGNDTVDASAITATPIVFFAGAGSDTFKGGGGNDAVFIAPTNLTSADTLQGGPGADNLYLNAAGTVSASAFANVTGFEGLSLSSSGNTVTLTNGLVTGASYFSVNDGGGNDNVDASAVTATPIVFFEGAGSDAFTGGSGDDAVYVAVADLTSADSLQGGAGVDNLYLTTAGTVAGSAFTNVTGFEGLVLSGLGNNVTLTNNLVAGSGNGVFAVADGAGNDTVDASGVTNGSSVVIFAHSGADTFKGGNGLNGYSFAVADLTSADTVVGGSAIDNLVFTTAGTLAASAFTNVTGIETIQLANGANNVTLTNGLVAGTSIGYFAVVGAANNDIVDASGVTNGTAIVFNGIAGGNDAFTGGNGSDSFQFAAGQLTAADTVVGGGGTDTLWMTTAGTTNTTDLAGVSGIEGVYLQNGGTFHLANGITAAAGLAATGSAAVDTFNASAVTTYSVSFSGNGGADALTGGSQNDTFFIADSAFASINGNGGIDRITLTAPSQSFNLTTNAAKISNLEVIDLNSSTNSTLTLAGTDIALINASGTSLYVVGDVDDTVNAGNGYTQIASNVVNNAVAPGHLFFEYQHSSGSLLFIDSAITAATATTGTGSANVPEGTAGGATVFNAQQAGATTYVLGGADAALFSIDGAGHISFNASPNFETPLDQGANNVYDLTVTSSNGTATPNFVENVTLTVTDVAPSTPADSDTLTADSVVEGAAAGTYTGVTASSTDVNGPTVSWLLTGDTSGGGFAIGADGKITVANASLINYETATHSYDVTAQASDGAGGTSSHTFTIAVTNTNPSAVTDSDSGTANSVVEGASVGAYTGLTASSADVNGPTVTWLLTADSSGGAFGIGADGKVTVIDPTLLDFETTGPGHTYSVTAQASDTAGGTASQSFNITVTNANPSDPADSDTATADTVDEGALAGAYTGVTAAATDPNGPAVTWLLTSDTSGGGFTIGADGKINVLDASKINYETATHSYDVTAQASDTAGGTSSHTFTINVGDVAPSTPVDGDTATADSVSQNAAVGAYTGVTASSTDVNGPTVIWSLTNDTSGGGFGIDSTGKITVIDSSKIIYNPGDPTYTVTAQASDGTLSSHHDFVITVVPNTAPTANDDAASATEAGGLNNATAGANPSGNVITAIGPGDVADTDPDAGDSVTVVAVGAGTEAAPTGPGTVNAAFNGQHGSLLIHTDGSYTYTVDQSDAAVQALRTSGQTLTDSFNYTIQDNGGLQDVATLTVTIHGANDNPTANADSVVAIEAGGVANGTPGTNPGGNVITGAGTAGAVADTDVDSAANGETTTVVGVAAGSPGGPLSGNVGGAGVVSLNGYGTLTIGVDGAYSYVVDNTNASVQALRTSAQTLTDTFSYTISDAAGAKSTTTVTVTIDGANDAPVAHADVLSATEAGGIANGTPGTNPSGNVITGAGSPGAVADTDVDTSGNGEILNVVGLATGTQSGPLSGNVGGAGLVSANGYGTLTIAPDGAYSYVVDNTNTAVQALRLSTQTLTDTFSYTLSDAAGATSTTTVTITIHGANDNPVANADAFTAIEAGGVANGAAGSNPAGNLLTGAGSATAVPDTDVDSSANGETTTVVGVATGTQAGPLSGNVGGAGVVSANGYGTLTVAADGSYGYVLNNSNTTVQGLRTSAQTLTDTFSYTISDAAGAKSTTTVTITIDGANDNPVANDDNVTATETSGTANGTAGHNPSGNLIAGTGGNGEAADTDVDTTANGETTTVQGVAAGNTGTVAQNVDPGTGIDVVGAHGTLHVNANGTYTYTVDNTAGNTVDQLNTGGSVPDQFTYTVKDTAGATSTAHVNITIHGADDAPVATADSYVAFENRAFTPNAATGVLANDTDIDTAHTSLTAVLDSGPSHAAAAGFTLNADGSFSYTAAAGYLGGDSFTYHADDGPLNSGTVTVSIDVQPLVWHIDNTASAVGEDGSAAHPWHSIDAFNAANAAAGTHPDIVYLHAGNGTYTTTDGINLNNGQTLLGQGVDLSYTTSASAPGGAHVVTLLDADNSVTPTIQVTGGAGNAGVTLAQGNTLSGFNISTTNADGIGIEDSNAAGTAGSVGTLHVDTVAISGTGKAIDIDQGGTLSNVHFSSIASTGSNSEGIQLGGIVGSTLGGSFTVDGATAITNADTTAIQVSTTAAGASFNFGSSTTVTDNAIGTGHTANGIDFTTGIGTTNSFNLGNTSITTDGGFGLAANGGTLNFGATNSINATGGAAVDLTSTNLSGATFGTVSSTNSTGAGIQISGLSTGNFTANGGAISNATGTDVSINGGTSSITYNGTITDDVGQLVSVANKTGGTVAFGGAITDGNDGDGSGISLTNNTGATINFTGGTTLSTGANAAFTATGGGTLNVTGANHIVTTTGTALNVANTTIGGSGLTFHDIFAGTAATGPTNAIILNNTGATAGLTVTGDATNTIGGDGTGGVIQHTGSDAIVLTSTKGVSLTNMSIHDTGDNGINGTNVNGFTFANGKIFNFGNGSSPAGQDEDGMFFTNLTGTVIIKRDTIGADGHFSTTPSIPDNHGIEINNDNVANLLMTVTGTTFTQISNDGIAVQIQRGNGTLNVDGTTADGVNTFNQINGRSITFASAADNAANGTLNLSVKGNTFTSVGIGARWDAQGGTTLNAVFENNTMTGTTNDAIRSIADPSALSFGPTTTVNATVSGNNFGGGSAFINTTRGATQNILFGGEDATHTGNTNIGGAGVNPSASSGAHLNIDILNNVIAANGNVASAGIYVQAARNLSSNPGAANAVVTANIKGNSVTDGPAGPNPIGDIVLDPVSAGDVIRLEGWNGSSPTAEAFLTAQNTFPADGVPDVVKSAAVSGFAGDTLPLGGPVPGALLAGSGGVASASNSPGETNLAQTQLDGAVAAALVLWAGAGLSSAQLAFLQHVTYSVADLSSGWLGQSTAGHVKVDVNADGHGWFVDTTPLDNSEFAHAASVTDRTTDPTTAAAGHMDLLTTVMHEMGEQLGLQDTFGTADQGHLSYGYLTTGERVLATTTDVAQINAINGVQTSEADIPQISQAPAGTPIVAGNAANNTIDAGHGGDVLFGGAGADTFVFGPGIQLNAPTPAQVTHVADYSAAQGDTFDFSAITSAFHNSSVSDALVVRAVEDASGKFATLQVDHIDPMGLPSAPNWVNVAQLDGAHAGDAVNVLIDNHSVHLAQIHVDLLV